MSYTITKLATPIFPTSAINVVQLIPNTCTALSCHLDKFSYAQW